MKLTDLSNHLPELDNGPIEFIDYVPFRWHYKRPTVSHRHKPRLIALTRHYHLFFGSDGFQIALMWWAKGLRLVVKKDGRASWRVLAANPANHPLSPRIGSTLTVFGGPAPTHYPLPYWHKRVFRLTEDF